MENKVGRLGLGGKDFLMFFTIDVYATSCCFLMYPVLKDLGK